MNKKLIFILIGVLVIGMVSFVLFQNRTEVTEQPEVTPIVEEDSDTKYGGTFVFGRGGDSVGLDPIQETDGESFKVAQQIYDTLIDYKPGTTDVIRL